MSSLDDFIEKGKWIFLLLVCAFFFFVSIKAAVTQPGVQKQVSNAVWVEDGKVHPENEGKLVAVVFHPSEWENAADSDLNVTFDAPVVRRTVQILKRTDNRYVWENAGTAGSSLTNAVFTGSSAAGGFSISPDLLLSCSTAKECGQADYSETALTALSSFAKGMSYGGYFWFSETPYGCMDALEEDASEASFQYYEGYEGSLRIRYSLMDLNSVESLVIVGYQEGNSLVKAEDLDFTPAHENVSSIDELLSQKRRSVKIGRIVVELICMGLIVLSVKKLKEL